MPGTLTKKLTLVALALGATMIASAHSDMDKPLFVSSDGIDSGRCLDALAPCRTISFALGRVGKGGEIRVAQGQYALTDPADVFHLVSGIVRIRGGFKRADDFRQPTLNATTLTGVPLEYRSMLSSQGFHVVADRKGIETETLAGTEKMLVQHKTMQVAMASAPCVGGVVAGLACENTELLAHVPFGDVSAFPGSAADVWGFVDLNTNREYAIVGYNIGTAVFDVSDPENPREVGFVDGQNTTWRDIKVYQFFNTTENRWNAFAYVTTDGSSDGLFVIDMTDLPQRISRQSYSSDFSAAHNVFAANTDYGTGLSITGDTPSLIIAGSNNGGGRFRVYGLGNAASPNFVTIPNVSNNDYMHDAATMIIRDSRKDTQCVNATTYCEVLFDFNESTVDIWDITDSSNPVRLSRTPYANSSYTHSGWPSEDGRFLFVHDELDEQNFGLATTLRTFSLANLASPSNVATWNGPTTAIDHNGFVRGNRYYMSNYTRGLTILDISNPASVQDAGRLDTYPFSDGANFAGAWGAFPYFPSGNIAVSDISSGLYMIGDQTLGSAQGNLSFTQDSYAGAEGGTINLNVQRTGGSSGAVSIDYEVLQGTADNADIASISGTLSWADTDTSDKTLVLTPAVDANAEGLEQLLVQLRAPAGGAGIAAQRLTNVYIADGGSSANVSFASATLDASERGFGMAVVTVMRSGNGSGAASVDYALSAGDATDGVDFNGPVNGTVSWNDGDALPKTLEFTMVDDGTGEADEFFELTLSNPSGASLGTISTMRVNVFDGSGANQAPNAVAGSSQTVSIGVLVTLNGGNSNDPDGDNLSYQWTQTMGPTVSLSNATSASATFTAPDVSSDTLFQFRLDVSDPSGLSDSSTANVTVRAGGSGSFGGGGGGGGSTHWLLLLALAALMARGRITRTGVA